MQSLPEFDGKKFQNVAKDGLKIDDSEKAKEKKEALEKEYETLLKWLKEDALKDKVKTSYSLWRYLPEHCMLKAKRHILHDQTPILYTVSEKSSLTHTCGGFLLLECRW